VHSARIALARTMSLAWRTSASGLVWRRWRSAASRCAPRMRPSLATKPAASSRACSTTLSLPEVLPEVAPVDADVPPAAEPAVVPAKLRARAGPAARVNRAQVRISRSIGWDQAGGAWMEAAASLTDPGRRDLCQAPVDPIFSHATAQCEWQDL